MVTGGAGFIGRAVCRALRAAGHEVVVLDNFSASARDGLNDYAVVEGDIRRVEDVRAALAGCEAAVHLAALVSVPLSIEKPEETRAINVEGFGNVLSAATAAGLAGPVLFASSAAVYGGLDQAPVSEADAALAVPLSPYAASKRENERQAAASGLRTVGLRFFNVYGPGQDPRNPYSGVLSILAAAAREGRTFTVFGDGEQTRDYVHVDDVAAAVAGLLAAPPAAGTVLNVGGGARVSLNDLVTLVGEVTGAPVKVERAAAREGDIRHSGAEIEAIEQILPGWRPRGLAQGLKDWLA
jgi:UDP-glucose 4-epimerase